MHLEKETLKQKTHSGRVARWWASHQIDTCDCLSRALIRRAVSAAWTQPMENQ